MNLASIVTIALARRGPIIFKGSCGTVLKTVCFFSGLVRISITW